MRDSASASVTETEAAFDKSAQAPVTATLIPSSDTFETLRNGSAALTPGLHYTKDGNNVMILPSYLATLEYGDQTLTFGMSGGTSPTLTITVGDSASALITVTEATFDKNAQENVTTTLIPSARTFGGLKNGQMVLRNGTDYIKDGENFTILSSYLSSLGLGEQTLTFDMDGGDAPELVITVKDSTSASLSVTAANFDKSAPADVTAALTPRLYTFTGLKNGLTALTPGKDYRQDGNDFTITKEYLASLALGVQTLRFDMDGGDDPTLVIAVFESAASAQDGDPAPNPTTGGGGGCNAAGVVLFALAGLGYVVKKK
jgi:hypothetical protein